MSALTTPPAYAWPADVLEFAREIGAEAYLEPMYRAAVRIFPNGTYAVVVEDDPEIRDDRHIVFRVVAPERDMGDPLEARHRWTDEFISLLTGPQTWMFRLSLTPTGS